MSLREKFLKKGPSADDDKRKAKKERKEREKAER